MRALFQRLVLSRIWLAFVVLGIAFFGFGAGTVNLGLLLMQSTRFLGEHGWRAVMDGGVAQLIELIATGYLSMASYIVFKTCEHRLSDWLGHGR